MFQPEVVDAYLSFIYNVIFGILTYNLTFEYLIISVAITDSMYWYFLVRLACGTLCGYVLTASHTLNRLSHRLAKPCSQLKKSPNKKVHAHTHTHTHTHTINAP